MSMSSSGVLFLSCLFSFTSFLLDVNVFLNPLYIISSHQNLLEWHALFSTVSSFEEGPTSHSFKSARPEAQHSPPFRAKVKNASIYTSTPDTDSAVFFLRLVLGDTGIRRPPSTPQASKKMPCTAWNERSGREPCGRSLALTLCSFQHTVIKQVCSVFTFPSLPLSRSQPGFRLFLYVFWASHHVKLRHAKLWIALKLL
jgi:hypothetical protein